MDTLEMLAVAQSLLKIGAVLAVHLPNACLKINNAAAKIEAAVTPADKVRAALNGLQDAADEARSILVDLAPHPPAKAP